MEKKKKNKHRISDKILKVLKYNGRCSTSKIAFIGFGSTNPWSVRRHLEKLEIEGIIKKEVETNRIYWRLK